MLKVKKKFDLKGKFNTFLHAYFYKKFIYKKLVLEWQKP